MVQYHPQKNQTKKKSPKTNGFPERTHPDDLDSRELMRVLSEVKNGNFAVRMPVDQVGVNGKICDTLNDIIILNEILMSELTKAGKTIGKKGNINPPG